MANNADDLYLNLMKLGKKLEAITIYSVENKCGLSDAKEHIENLEKRNITFIKERTNDDELIKLLNDGNKLLATKFYRDGARCSLKEAKDYVENIERSGKVTPFVQGSNHHLKTGKTKFEGCFIATVCYGGYDTPEVIELRRFRDDVLLKTTTGKLFVKLYYKFSPDISKAIGKSDTLKKYIRKYFLDKIFNYINLLK